MHLSLRRRDTKRPSTPPPQQQPATQSTAATTTDTSTPEAAGMPGKTADHEFLATAQTSPHGLKGIGRRMTTSKPLRVLKTLASRTSLRGHGRRVSGSASSIRSMASQREDAVLPERKSGDTDYGKEEVQVARDSTEPVENVEMEKGQGMGEGEGQAVVTMPRENGQVEHEAEARQQESTSGEQVTKAEESETRVEQLVVGDEEHTAPAVEAAIEAVDTDAKDVSSDVPTDADQTARHEEPERSEEEEHDPLTASSVSTRNAETISLSSSSTTVDHNLAGDKVDNEKSELKQVRMEPENGHVQEVALSKDEVNARDTKQDAVEDINPFLVDDPEDPLSEPEAERDGANSPPAKGDVATPTVQSVVLESTSTATPPPTEVVDENVSAPIPPAKTITASPQITPISPTSSEEEAPELHTPALTVTSLFLPVPQTDPLSALLTKHVPEPQLRPPRDTSGEWQHTDFHALVMTNNWRALARMARDRIVAANPRDVELVLNLWYIRLSSLARLRLFNQTSAECENLFSVLATIEPPTARAYILRNVLPFELEVLRARCAYWVGDHIGYLDDVSALLHRCRVRARAARDAAELAMWKERGARMALIVASQLVEMKDYTAAISLLEPLLTSSTSTTASGTPSPPSPALRSAIARIYLQAGLLSAAAAHFDAVDADPEAEPTLKSMNVVVRAAADGDWAKAADVAREIVEGETGDVVAANNYAVALLGQGRIKEGIQILESTLQTSPSATTTTEPYLFNLSTMYELRAGLTVHRKRDLLIEVAKWSGDGLRTACLKMNA